MRYALVVPGAILALSVAAPGTFAQGVQRGATASRAQPAPRGAAPSSLTVLKNPTVLKNGPHGGGKQSQKGTDASPGGRPLDKFKLNLPGKSPRHPGKAPRLPAPSKLKPKQQDALKQYYQKQQANLQPTEKAAVNKVLSGTPLSRQDRDSLSRLLLRGDGLTTEVREAMAQALADDLEAREAVQTMRYLRVHNATPERVRVWLRYHTLTDENEWRWLPGSPESGPALSLEIEPGQTVSLKSGGRPVAASRVRIWARSGSGTEWAEHRETDAWLVPETSPTGEHFYTASTRETHTYTFEPSQGVARASR